MNVIDQAFVKAFARRTQPQSARPATAADVTTEPAGLPAADMTVNPQAPESAVMWYDTAAQEYFRRDEGHCPAAPLGDSPLRQGPRTRRLSGLQPAPAAPPLPVNAELAEAGQAEPTDSIDLATLCHSEIAFAVQPALLGGQPVAHHAPQPVLDPIAAAAPSVVPASPPLSSAAPVPAPAHVSAAPAHVSAPAPGPAGEPFSAMWEVDRLEFSSTVTALFSDRALVQSIGHPLDRAVNEGLQILLITGDRTGVGQTSVATGIAISAAAAGLRVALVDGTSAATGDGAGGLADALNLEVQQGWPETLRAGRPIAEAAVHSIEDQLTVIPQATLRQSAGPTAEEFRRLIEPLRQAFDLVVIDGPCCREPAFKGFTATEQPISGSPLRTPSAEVASARPSVDAVILVQDIRNADQVLTKQVMQSLRFHGITGLGLVENFT